MLDYYPASDDGYTLSAYYQPNPRVHGPIRIKYRPTPILDRATLLEVRNTTNEKTFSLYLSKWMQTKIVGWSIKIVNAHGELVPMPITAENILQLKPPLWKRLVDTVCWGFDGGDEDPEVPSPDRLPDAERELQAILAKQGQVDAKVEELQKN
jgi:hypothetical protein